MRVNPSRTVILALLIVMAGCQYVKDTQFVDASKAYKQGNYSKAARQYSKVLESKDYDERPAAQFQLAEMFFKGRGVAIDKRRALSLWEEVAEGNDRGWASLAFFKLGSFAETGVSNIWPIDRVKAANYYARGVALGDESAAKRLGHLVRHPDVFVARHMDEFSAGNKSHAPAGIGRGIEHFKAAEYEKAFSVFLWHARNGNATAQRTVSIFYAGGLKTPKDLQRHAAWNYLSAFNGDRKAQFRMGLLYRQSDHIPVSDKDAEKWFKAALQQGEEEAENELGLIYLYPYESGRKPDALRAAKSFLRAAKQGSSNGMLNLADMYLKGKVLSKDRDKAKRWYLLAGKRGNLTARSRLYEHFQIQLDDDVETKGARKSSSSPRDSKRAENSKNLAGPLATSPRNAVQKSVVELYAELSPAVFQVFALRDEEKLEELSQGTAIAISNRLALTNCHVLEGMNVFGAKIGDDIVRFVSAARDKVRDICVLYAAKDFSTKISKIRNYRSLKVGEKVYAIGSPKGLDKTLSEGLVSGLRLENNIRYIQTSASISSGSSGGGLFDAEGRLVGITTFGIKGGQNLNFAVAIEEALVVLQKAKK